MKQTIYTHEDGWDCVPELREVTSILRAVNTYSYEIDNCVRESDLDNLVFEMKELLEEAIDQLNTIDVDIEYKTTSNQF